MKAYAKTDIGSKRSMNRTICIAILNLLVVSKIC